jgi:hypothetical protein
MKNTTVTTATVTVPALVNETKASEVIRSADVIARDVLEIGEDNRVSIRKGADVSPSELAGFILDRDSKAKAFGVQARWAYYSAGMLPNGDHVQEEIANRLREAMSSSAFTQLKSEATKYCPLLIKNGFKTPLSVFKDLKAEFKFDDDGKLLPLAKQSRAAKELLPLVKDGTATQAKGREIRKKYTTASGNPTPSNPKPAPVTSEAKSEITRFSTALRDLKALQAYLASERLEGDDRQSFVNGICEIGRLLGLQVTVPNAKPATTPATTPAKQK